MAEQKDIVVDISGFRQVVKQLSKISGKDFETAMKAEAGHILAAAIRKTPKATKKKVVKRTMPQGFSYGGGTGGRLVTNWTDGKNYHVGLPIQGGGTTNAAPGKSEKKGGSYIKPYTYWLRRNRWAEFIQQQKEKVKTRTAKKGLSASQFYFMSVLLGAPMPKQPPKYIKNSNLGKIVLPFLSPRVAGSKKSRIIILESKGFKQSIHSAAQHKLMIATAARIKFFVKAMRKEFIQDLKGYMPKNYPLLFK